MQSHENSSSCGVPAGAPSSIPYRPTDDPALAPVLAETTQFLGHSLSSQAVITPGVSMWKERKSKHRLWVWRSEKAVVAMSIISACCFVCAAFAAEGKLYVVIDVSHVQQILTFLSYLLFNS